MSIPEIIVGLDIVRFLVALWGLLYCSLELHDVIADKNINVRNGVNGIRLAVANNNIQAEQLRLILHCIFIVLAASSLMWPMVDPDGLHLWPRRLVSDRLFLISGTMVLTRKSWLARDARKRILEYSKRRRVTDPPAEEDEA